MAIWSEHDINVLKEMYEDKPQEEIIKKLEVQRKWNAVRAKGISLGMARKRNVPTEDKRKKYLSMHKHCDTSKYQGVVCDKNEELIRELNDTQQLLINEIQRYCEENRKFPTEKDMSNKRGYVSRTQFYKYFNCDTFTLIYRYIFKIEEEKPTHRICSKCNIRKELSESNYSRHKASKFGLKTMCKKCENWESIKRSYKNRGIIFDEFTDISPEQWWEYYNERKIHYMPDFCYESNNIIKIVRYVSFNKIGIKSRQDLIDCEFLNDHIMKAYRIYYLYRDRYNKYDFINMCFPEFNIKEYDMPITYYSDDIILEMIDNFIASSGLSVEDIMDGNYSFDDNQKVKSMIGHKFKDSPNTIFIWYFNKRNVLHPQYNREIDIFDFRFKPNNFYNNADNRKEIIKRHCIKYGIEDVLFERENLSRWASKYFKQPYIPIWNYYDYYDSSYDMLLDGMPIINEMSLLEFHEFYSHVARDGTVCDSEEELSVYEFIKYTLGINNIKAIGTSRDDKHCFILPPEHTDNRYFPDFVIEGICDKPIYVEYFGLYEENPTDRFKKEYYDKTIRKNDFYHNLRDIYYIDLYPSDLRNNMKSISDKINCIFSNSNNYAI